MTIALPFFGKLFGGAAKQRDTSEAVRRQGAWQVAPAPRRPRPLRASDRLSPTTYQRCLAVHLYFAERSSALD